MHIHYIAAFCFFFKIIDRPFFRTVSLSFRLNECSEALQKQGLANFISIDAFTNYLVRKRIISVFDDPAKGIKIK